MNFNLLQQLSKQNDSKRKLISIGFTVVISLLLTLVGIYGFEDYGIAIFVLIPFFIGFCSVFLYSYKNNISRFESISIGYITLAICTILLMLCALERLICIVMAAPFGVLFTWMGSILGYQLAKSSYTKSPSVLLVFIAVIPLTSFIEKDIKPELQSVTTLIIINSNAEKVWKNVIEFPELAKPNEFIFKTGIAYPINAKIDGNGVGAIRNCNFTTGSFVEPITVWDENKLLEFDVLEQPAPMKEISFYNIDAPHLHDYFVSKKGQFKLTQINENQTLLEGTTWYYHNIKPKIYWKQWSNFIIHKIHNRVLNHIKIQSEKK